jgi:hypothetical protein
MNSQEFRAAPELVAEAKKIMGSETFRLMLSAIEHEAPHNQESTNAHVILEPAASYALGEIKGWMKCLKALQELGTFVEQQPDTHIEPTYTDTTPAEETQNG